MEDENLNRNFKGIWIPKEIWLDTRLSALDKIILMEINSLDDEKTGCYASNKYLAKFCQCTETKVSTTITKLKELGYIELAKFDGRHRSLKTKSLPLKNLKSDIKNFKSINIDNNIDNNINNINIINNENLKNDTINDTIIKPKKEMSTRQKNAIERTKILEEFIKDEDEDIKKALRDYVDVRRKRGLEPKQLKIILEDFEKVYSNKPKAQVLNQIRKATARGWSALVYEDTFKGSAKSSYSSQPTFDNTATHIIPRNTLTEEEWNKLNFEEKKKYLDGIPLADLTPKQLDFHYQYCLARNPDGSYMKF